MSACCWRLRKTLNPIRDSKNSTQPINAMASTPEPPSHPLPNPTPTVPTNPSGSVFLGYGNPPQFPHAASPGWPSRLVSPRPARSWSPSLLPFRPWLTLSVPGLFIGPGWSTHRRAPVLPWLPPSLGRSCPRKGPGPCLLPHPQTHHFLDPPWPLPLLWV